LILLYTLLNLILFPKNKNEKDSCNQSSVDSIESKMSGQLYITSKFKQFINFDYNNNLEYDISAKLNMTRIRNGNLQRSKQELISELSFTRYIDSITVVDEDLIEFTSNWEFRFKSILNTLNLKIKSQFTNAYEYVYFRNTFTKVLAKELFFPVSVSIGTGFNYTFRKSNYINFSLIDIKTMLISKTISESNSDSHKLTGNLYHLPEVGLSINSSIYKSWSKETFSWRNNSKIFFKGFTKKDININLRNRFMYEIFKWINISFENQIIYDPIYTYRIQLKNEVVVGVLFKK